MVHSHLLYGIVIWGNTHDNHLKILIILQNKAFKIVTATRPCYTILSPITNLETERLVCITVYEVTKLMHQNSRKNLLNCLNCLFTILLAEVESMTQGSRPRPRTQKNPRPRPRTAFPRTDTLEAKDRNARGQGQGPRTQAQVLSKKKKKSSQKFFKRSPQKKFSKKFFNRSTKL